MRGISLFSGAGGFEIGFTRAGIETVLQAEIDPWCLTVLERHFPYAERVDDVRKVDAARWAGRRRDMVGNGFSPDAEWLRAAAYGQDWREHDPDGADLVYGGFPCQDVSVAGQRAGLRGERSALWFEFERVLRELQPRWVAIENVPGLLSSGPRPGADFSVILRGLVDLGYGVAWRTLDARWFGVAQRRRRVFIVGCLGSATRAAQVLAVCESCGGHPAPRREAGESVAYSLAASARDAGKHLADDDANLILGSQVDDGMARPLVARATGYRMDIESENFVLADPILPREGKTYSHEGSKNFRMHNAVAFKPSHYTRDKDGAPSQLYPALSADADKGDQDPLLLETAGVRRLTPLECERLMGWPDDWTRWTAGGKEIVDSHRYRLCGNGVVATVAEWIGHRLVSIDEAMA